MYKYYRNYNYYNNDHIFTENAKCIKNALCSLHFCTNMIVIIIGIMMLLYKLKKKIIMDFRCILLLFESLY